MRDGTNRARSDEDIQMNGPHERPNRVIDDPWWMFLWLTVGTLFRTGLKFRLEGAEHIPAQGPAIIAANHLSPIDPIALGLAASRRGRTVRFLAAAESFDIPLIGWGLRRLRQIPIHRGSRDLAAIRDAADVVAAGALAGIYPEGELGPGSELLPAKKGMARLALAAGAPIVPAGMWGMQHRWPKGRIRFGLPFRPVAAVVIGEPIPAEGDPASDDDVRDLTDRVMAAIATLVARATALALQGDDGTSE
jgi:1-acyl-sn-glycerol-3-phosphate acyltransferase